MKRILSEFRLYLCNRWVASFPSHTFRLWFYRVIMKFSIGKKTTIFMDCTFDDGGNLTIGDNCVINGKCRIDTSGPVTIGRHVSISQEVCILTGDHNVDSSMFEGRRAPVIIEDYVWIGTRAMILKGCTIGKGAIVAGGALVIKDVEPYSVVAGVPAKAVKTRRTDLKYEVDYRRLFQ